MSNAEQSSNEKQEVFYNAQQAFIMKPSMCGIGTYIYKFTTVQPIRHRHCLR